MALAAGSLLAGGCVTPDQLRQTEAQTVEQKQAVEVLRVETSRTESSIADLRADLRRTQAALQELQVGLADLRSRTDATQAATRDFLSNLVAARDEQRRQLADSNTTFADLRRRLADLEARLQGQQRAIEQNAAVLVEANRRLAATESGLADAQKKAVALETRLKADEQADATLTRQVQSLQTQVADTRAVLRSESMLELMRGLQNVQRDTAMLRGAIEQLEHGQAESATRARNYYTDLDARIRTLRDKLAEQEAALAAQAARLPAAEGSVESKMEPGEPAGDANATLESEPAASGTDPSTPAEVPVQMPAVTESAVPLPTAVNQ